jgi:hypothetical protein
MTPRWFSISTPCNPGRDRQLPLRNTEQAKDAYGLLVDKLFLSHLTSTLWQVESTESLSYGINYSFFYRRSASYLSWIYTSFHFLTLIFIRFKTFTPYNFLTKSRHEKKTLVDWDEI